MLKLPDHVKVYVCLEPVDFRKGINGLCVHVANNYSEELMTGDIYLFLNKKRDMVKGLYWHRNGFVLHQKRLEEHKFILPKLTTEATLTISEVQLHGLLAGLDFTLMDKFSEINYTDVL